MAYLGNSLSVQQYAPQVAYFSGNGSTTAFTLPVSVVSAAQIIVSVANVVQNPSSAFTVSGTTLTFTSAPPSGTNNIWVEYTSLQTNTIAPSQGTVQNSSFGTVTALPMTYATLGAGNASIMKNRIINGAMVIDQRNNGASVTPTAEGYTLDRWKARLSQSSKYSVQQVTTAPAGFNNSIKVTSLSSYTVGSGELFCLQQPIEGYNVADLGFGTANAKTITVSFWVQSSLTGTFGGALNAPNGTRSYPFSYTISSANTWTQIFITIAGDTTGTYGTTNGEGFSVFFSLGTGSTLSGTAGSWSGSTYVSVTGATSVVGTNGATFYITGVQLEVGSSATGFEYRQYGQELALCQRYYYLGSPASSSLGIFGRNYATSTGYTYPLNYNFPVTMRAIPTITVTGTWTYSNSNSLAPNGPTVNSPSLGFNSAGSGDTYVFSGTTGSFNASAEL